MGRAMFAVGGAVRLSDSPAPRSAGSKWWANAGCLQEQRGCCGSAMRWWALCAMVRSRPTYETYEAERELHLRRVHHPGD